MIKRGTLVYLLPGFEGILTFPEGVGFFSLHNVQPDFSDLSPGVELNFVLENCIGIKHGTPFYHLELLWTLDVCDVVRETRHEISTALKVFNIYTGGLSEAVSAILLQERSEISSIPIQRSGIVCFEISDREGVIRLSNMNYVWFYLLDISAVILKTLIGQKVCFESEVLWKSWTEKSSWSVASCLYTPKNELLHCESLEDVPVLSTIGERLRSASMNACVRSSHKLFLDLIGEVQKSTKLAEPLANTGATENLRALPQNIAECSALQDSKGTNNKNISKEIHPSHINTCTTETLYFLNRLEAFFVVLKNRSIIWLHQDHIDKKCSLTSLKPNATTTIHFAARRLWCPPNEEGFALYEATQVWRTGLKMSATPSETTIKNCFNPSVVALTIIYALAQEKKEKDDILEEALPLFMVNKVASSDDFQNMPGAVIDYKQMVEAESRQPTNMSPSTKVEIHSRYITTCTTETLYFLNRFEAFFVILKNRRIIWLHQDHIDKQGSLISLKPNAATTIHFSARRLWCPPNEEGFALYEATHVWRSGLKMPSAPSDTIIHNCFNPSVVALTIIYALAQETKEKDKILGGILQLFMTNKVELVDEIRGENIQNSNSPRTVIENTKMTVTELQAMDSMPTSKDKTDSEIEGSSLELVRFLNNSEGYLVSVKKKEIIIFHKNFTPNFVDFNLLNSVYCLSFIAKTLWRSPNTSGFSLHFARMVWGTGVKKPKPTDSSARYSILYSAVQHLLEAEKQDKNKNMEYLTSYLVNGNILNENHRTFLSNNKLLSLFVNLDHTLKRPQLVTKAQINMPSPSGIESPKQSETTESKSATSVTATQSQSTTDPITISTQAQPFSLFDRTSLKTGTVITENLTEANPDEATQCSSNIPTSTQAKVGGIPNSAHLKTVSAEHPDEVEIQTNDIVRFINDVEGYLVDYKRKRIVWFDDKAASRFVNLIDVNNVPELYYRAKIKWAPTTTDSFALYRAYLIWGTASKKPKVNSYCYSGRSLLDLATEKISALEGPEGLNHKMAAITLFLSNGILIKEHENYLRTSTIFGLYKPIDSKLKRPSILPVPNNIYLKILPASNIASSTIAQLVPSTKSGTVSTKHTTAVEHVESTQSKSTNNIAATTQIVRTGVPLKSGTVSSDHVTEVKSAPGTSTATSVEAKEITPADSTPLNTCTLSAMHPTEIEHYTTATIRFINEAEGYLVDYKQKRIIWIDNKSASSFAKLTDANCVSVFYYRANVKWSPHTADSFAFYRAYLICCAWSKRPPVLPDCYYGRSLLEKIIENTSKLEGPEVLNHRMAVITSFLSNGIINEENEKYLKTSKVFELYNTLDSKSKRSSTVPLQNNSETPSATNIPMSTCAVNYPGSTSTKHPPAAEKMEGTESRSASNIDTSNQLHQGSHPACTPLKTVSTKHASEVKPVEATQPKSVANIATTSKKQVVAPPSGTNLPSKTITNQHPSEIDHYTTETIRFINEEEGYLVDHKQKRIIWIDNKSASSFAKLTDANCVPIFYYRAKITWSPHTTDNFALYRAYLICGAWSKRPQVLPDCYNGRSLVETIMEKTSTLKGREVLNHRMAVITSFLSNGIINEENEDYLRTSNVFNLFKPLDSKLKRTNMVSGSLAGFYSCQTVSALHPAEVESNSADTVRFISKVEGYLVDYQRKRIIWIDDKSASPFARLTDVNNVPQFYYRAKLKWAPPTETDSFALYRAYLIWGTASKKPTVNSTCFSGTSLLDVIMKKTSSVECSEVLNDRMAMITSFLSNGKIIKKHENYLRTSNVYALYQPVNPGLKRPKELSAANKIRIYSNPPSVPPSIQPTNSTKVSSVVNRNSILTTVPTSTENPASSDRALVSNPSSNSSRVSAPSETGIKEFTPPMERDVQQEEQSQWEEALYSKQSHVFYDDDDDDDDDYECDDDEEQEDDEFDDLRELEDLSTSILMKLMLKKLNLELKAKSVCIANDNEMSTFESPHCLHTANENLHADEEVKKSSPSTDVSFPLGSTPLTDRETNDEIDCLPMKRSTERTSEKYNLPAKDSPGAKNIVEGICLHDNYFQGEEDVVSNDPIHHRTENKTKTSRNGQLECEASTVLPSLNTTSSPSHMLISVDAAKEVVCTDSTRDGTSEANLQRQFINGGGYVYGNQLEEKRSESNCVIS